MNMHYFSDVTPIRAEIKIPLISIKLVKGSVVSVARKVVYYQFGSERLVTVGDITHQIQQPYVAFTGGF